jgi:hypothetical protein
MTGLELGDHFGLSDSWGRGVIREIKNPEPSPAPSPEEPELERNETTPAPVEQASLPPIVTPPSVPELSPVEILETEPAPAVPAETVRNEPVKTQAEARTPLTIAPVWLLMIPAAVAIWSGWVGLGELAGFGPVRLLPGIADDFVINSAITLPIGMETYAAYALYVWLSGKAVGKARSFARRSAVAALVIGALGQIAYHVMAAAEVSVAPWWITAGVACLPVAVLGMGAALAHMVRAEADLNIVSAVSGSNLEG